MQRRFINNNTLRYALYFIAVLPIFILRDFTPDNELRYLSIADEALRNGSIFTFTNHGLTYADKPPLYLWIVMLGKQIFGHHNLIFLGIFSYLPALVIVYVMDNWVKSALSESERLTGRLMLLTSGFFIGTAIILRMDMLMCMFIILALYTFFKRYSGEGKPRDSWLFPVFIFLALFTKGPMGIIVPLVSTVVFLILKKESKNIGKYWGWKTLGVLLTLCGAWFTGVYAEGGNLYLNNLLFNQTVNRAVNSFHHKEPIFYYLLAILYSLAPWSLLIGGILIAGLKKRLVSTDLELFFLTIALTTFVTLSLFSSKLAVYLLPAFPFFVYLSVLWFAKLGSPKWMSLTISIPACILCLALPGVIVASNLINTNGIGLSPVIIGAAFVLTGAGIIAIKQLVGNKLQHGIIAMGTGLLLSVFVVSFAIPKLNPVIGQSELCNHAKKVETEKGASNYYYCEMGRADNLDVYLGQKPQKLLIRELFEPNSEIKKPAVLFLWDKAIEVNDSLQVFIKGKTKYRHGNYYFVEIDE